jgi:hypothetical protein
MLHWPPLAYSITKYSVFSVSITSNNFTVKQKKYNYINLQSSSGINPGQMYYRYSVFFPKEKISPAHLIFPLWWPKNSPYNERKCPFDCVLDLFNISGPVIDIRGWPHDYDVVSTRRLCLSALMEVNTNVSMIHTNDYAISNKSILERVNLTNKHVTSREVLCEKKTL